MAQERQAHEWGALDSTVPGTTGLRIGVSTTSCRNGRNSVYLRSRLFLRPPLMLRTRMKT